MKRLLLLSAVAVVAFATAVPTARAGSATNTLTVSATVLGICTIDPATLAFPNYDPTAANTDATATITVHCTSGSSYWIGLGLGGHATGAGARRMAGGATEFLTYELYRDAGRSTVWDDAIPTTTPPTSTASNAAPGYSAYTATVYGRIGGGQAVSTGGYSDTVTMTVNF
jgi:spore coat protein U-like protein